MKKKEICAEKRYKWALSFGSLSIIFGLIPPVALFLSIIGIVLSVGGLRERKKYALLAFFLSLVGLLIALFLILAQGYVVFFLHQ